MQLIIVSGLSGSGKSVALNTLEDEGFYCVDNLPTGLLEPLLSSVSNRQIRLYDRIAVGIDARSDAGELRELPQTVARLARQGVETQILFLHAEMKTLIRRFSETRRKHPMSRKGMPLMEAIEVERAVLSEVNANADLSIDTTQLNLHSLRDLIKERLLAKGSVGLSLLFQSFGFKNGLPGDTDFVFDVRCLPNPHWEPRLREKTGRDSEVVKYLNSHPMVETMYKRIRDFLEEWIPQFQAENRSYITVSVGCTGGRHRSVYLADKLYDHFRVRMQNVAIRHRELQ
jgi:UPF0042 nucleotide-binding protein